MRDAYDFLHEGLETPRSRRYLKEDVISYFDYAADEYAWGGRPGSDPA